MTRGREANTAHLIAADLADAREQWIAVFTRDRADLGPAHAGQLAAAEVARYAAPRPLEQVLADLHAAWTAEQHALAVLAWTGPQLEPLRQLVASGLNPSGRVRELEGRERQSRRDFHQAGQQVKAAEATVSDDTDRIRKQLLDAWDADRARASRAAWVVGEGPGRFRQRRAAVNQAGQELIAWADAWRRDLPYLPTDVRGLAIHATWFENYEARWKALDAVARNAAEQAHPELTELKTASTAARDSYIQATRALEEGRDEQKQLRSRYGYAVHTPDPPAALAEMEQKTAAARTDLTAARAHIQNLPGELALLGQPPERIARERDVWQGRRNDADRQRRARQAARYSSPQTPTPRRSVGRPGHGIGR
jgi:hypothetical protein